VVTDCWFLACRITASYALYELCEVMNNKQTEKAAKVSKPFMAVGPTLHYSHKNVVSCWLLALAVFVVSCLFWSKILTGTFWSCDIEAVTSVEQWRLGQYVINGVSIFEYPWQILVLGLLMGILGVAPVLVSQLMSVSYSLPFIAAIAFIGNVPAFAICVLLSCIAAACRPLRFRSRFIAIALCTAPQLLYWGYFGGTKGLEPLKFGFSFTPWICAWIVSLSIAALVLGIGHFTRYRPGLVWIVSFVFLVLAIVTFEIRIGFDELDYQLYVAKNNPEQIVEFHDHSIREALDKTTTNPGVKRYLSDFFYPTEPIALRAELKRQILAQVSQGRWPWWFRAPAELRYQAKREELLKQYDLFISRRPMSSRMPIALYYKGLLSEYSPDIKMLEHEEEVLHLYSDYPQERSLGIWHRLYSNFGESPESLEARWRISMSLAGVGRFEQADKLAAEAQIGIRERLSMLEKEQPENDTFFSPFRPPADSVMTAVKLTELQRRLNQLRNLISTENRTDKPGPAKRLARFVMLNSHDEDYAGELEELLEQTSGEDPLRDNILLAQVKLIADEHLRAEKLGELHKKFEDKDGGMQALYELGLLKIGLWRQQDESNMEQKKKYLADARATLTSFIGLYPDSFCAEQVKRHLDSLPNVE